ncbi:homeobox domain-containing protein [Paraphaeosphaeria minitans]|uniref:Homeobox domain-containing protein n=1 Tax=Paraphaeosphaeria minitans TaxID=565426 RepID=A0A9P6KMN6_9PLEO|nr:homeobox domain-containing protein [Paraphaeosphaeria minitans]
MEYLTLHDIPQRHMYSARRMATPDELRGSERTLPALPVFLEPPSNFSPKRVFPHWLTPSTLAPTVRIPTENWSGSVSKLSTTSVKLPPITEDRRRQRLDSLAPVYSHSLATDMAQGNYSNDDLPQNNLTRHSPPVQPNERQPSSVGLPSFSQLLKNVHSEPSPPRTPNRSNGSNDSSPVGHSTQWDDVVWGGDSKRRRLDSSDGQYRPAYPAESLDYEPRRPSAIDPTLGEPYGQTYHRPSLPFVPQSASMATHVRHQSSPIPQGNTQYQNHAAPTHHSVSGPSGYSVHAGQYDRQPSYYPEPHPSAHAHAYERAPSNAYYVPSLAYMTNGAYNPHAPPQSYNSYTFQSSLGVDQSSFNRKRRGNLPKEATAILKKWFADHRDSPYPTEEEKLALCQKCQLTLNQVSNWFINARRRAPGREQRDARENTENLG